MFNVSITPAERNRLIAHFTRLLKTEAAPGRIVERDMVLDCLTALQLLEGCMATEADND